MLNKLMVRVAGDSVVKGQAEEGMSRQDAALGFIKSGEDSV